MPQGNCLLVPGSLGAWHSLHTQASCEGRLAFRHCSDISVALLLFFKSVQEQSDNSENSVYTFIYYFIHLYYLDFAV